MKRQLNPIRRHPGTSCGGSRIVSSIRHQLKILAGTRRNLLALRALYVPQRTEMQAAGA